MSEGSYITLVMAALLVAAACGLGCTGEEPEDAERTPLYRWGQDGQPSSGERGNMMISEINFAGSVTDDGVRDVDDVFIELQNKHPRPINVSRWHLIVEGEVEQTWRIPAIEEPIMPNDYFVIARKKDGAFLYADLRLQESAGSPEEEAFAGGWDTVTVRSMERVQLIFGNRGEQSRNWHAYSDSVGFDSIREGWRKFTLSSPGEANSTDYSGSSTSGNFE